MVADKGYGFVVTKIRRPHFFLKQPTGISLPNKKGSTTKQKEKVQHSTI